MVLKEDDRTPQRQAIDVAPPTTEEIRNQHQQIREEKDNDLQFVCEEFQELSFNNPDTAEVLLLVVLVDVMAMHVYQLTLN